MRLRSEYERDVDRALARFAAPAAVGEGDLLSLPPLVQSYLRRAGIVGQARVLNVRARMHGRIRRGPDQPWMPLHAEQYNFYDQPSRHFYLSASMKGVPVRGYHRYVGAAASMRVRAAGLITVAHVSGPLMTRTETVTLLNDMCFLAPATLVYAPIQWNPMDAQHVGASFSNAGHTIRAVLEFDEASDLVTFWSDDRGELAADGKTLTPGRWSTPLGRYREFQTGLHTRHRLASRGEARYARDGLDSAYIELDVDEVRYNLDRRSG